MQIENWEQEDCIEQQCQMLQLLLNQKMTSFHFPPRLRSVHQGAVSDLWHSLLREKPPNLTTIVSNWNYIEIEEGEIDWDIEASVASILPVFPKLQVLKIAHFVCDDAELSRISLHLPCLR
jgi:hypothetical protein